MSSRDKALTLYRKFREEEPTKIGKVSFALPDYVMSIGFLEYVGYNTTIGKKSVLFEHSFATGSRPRLCASADGRQLLIVGGRYNFKADGIVDQRADGSDIYPKNHGR